MLKKTINGKTTTFTFDGANQLVSSTTDGVTTKYAYDAAGRLVKEGDKTYRYGYLDKVLSVTEGERKYTYDYHVDGQLARADYGNGGRAGCPQPTGIEDFLWDGLALIRRGDERFVNEPHVGGGNPIASSKGVSYFNDMLGTTVGTKKAAKYTPAALTAFGETIENGSVRSTPTPSTYTSFYTGKPHVAGLGHIFLFRNYRASLAKWQTADPLGYPDGWNQLAYCGNACVSYVDYIGCETWGYYQEITAQTNANYERYASLHHSDHPVRGERYEHFIENVLVNTKDYGIREIDGHTYHVYADYYYDVYASEIYGALDPLGNFRSAVAAAGIAVGVGGLVVAFANPLVGITVTVAGISIGIAGIWEPNWEYLGNVYRIHPETLQIKWRKELIE